MRILKNVLALSILGVLLYACSANPLKKTGTKEEPVVIANDSLEYEIIIMDVGFTNYLNSIARPVGFYSQTYLEQKNRNYVQVWNYRARNTPRFNADIYANVIDYQMNVDYGYDVNYKLFNYFEFAQRKYRMRLGPYSTNYIR